MFFPDCFYIRLWPILLAGVQGKSRLQQKYQLLCPNKITLMSQYEIVERDVECKLLLLCRTQHKKYANLITFYFYLFIKLFRK